MPPAFAAIDLLNKKKKGCVATVQRLAGHEKTDGVD